MAPGVCRCSVTSPIGDTPSGVVARRTSPSGVASFGRVTHAPADPRALYRAMMWSTYIRLGLRAHGRRIIESVCPILGPRCYRGHGVGGPHKTTTLITVLPAASAATAFLSGRMSERLFIVERKQNSCAIVLSTHPLEIEVCEEMCSADPECPTWR